MPVKPPKLEPGPPGQPEPRLTWRSIPAMRYPTPYLWIILFSALDVILTRIILTGGDPEADISSELEINPIARMIIDHWTMTGATVFKFAIALLVILICEFVGRVRDRTGRWLAWVCVVISAFPVAWSLILLFINRLEFFEEPIGW